MRENVDGFLLIGLHAKFETEYCFTYFGSMDCISFRKSAERAWKRGCPMSPLLITIITLNLLSTGVLQPYLWVHVMPWNSHGSHLFHVGSSETSKWRRSHLKCWTFTLMILYRYSTDAILLPVCQKLAVWTQSKANSLALSLALWYLWPDLKCIVKYIFGLWSFKIKDTQSNKAKVKLLWIKMQCKHLRMAED